MKRIVVVGASAAGLTAAETLREEGFDGELVLVNGERHDGYDRPPLSKAVLAGRMDAASLALRPADFYDTHRIDHRVDVRAQGLDVGRRTVSLDNGERIAFDGLIIATGLRSRPLPRQSVLRGLHMLRTLDDALALRQDLGPARQVVIVGAGILGCEIAATISAMDKRVTLVEPLARPMARQLGHTLAAAAMAKHRSHGTDVRAGHSVAEIERRSGRVAAIVLDDGVRLAADVVVVAIGSLPNTQWLQDSGLLLDDGVACDAFCRAGDGIFAAGDVASWMHPRLGMRVRIEHRQQATEQAVVAARNLLGASEAYDPLPYFWTDFHDAKIQVFGRIGAGDTMHVVSGRIGEPGFTAAYSHGGTVTAVAGWNAARRLRPMGSWVGLAQSVVRTDPAMAI